MNRLFLGLILALTCQFSFAEIKIGPYPTSVRCPVGTESSQNGKHFCIFRDPKIVQAGYGRCPIGLANSINTSVGKDNWCIVKTSH